MDSWAEMEEQILEELNLHRMKADAEVFSRLERYSGSEAGEAADAPVSVQQSRRLLHVGD